MSDYAYDEGYRAGMQKMREVGQRRIEELEAKLAKAVAERDEVLNRIDSATHTIDVLKKRVAEIKGQDDEV